jgi:uncharacterized protein (TIGR02145 family)
MKNKSLLIAIAILLIALNTSAQVKIGTQTWATKNLETSTFRNGDKIQEAATAQEWEAAAIAHKPAWCYYKNDSANGKIYGKLYNWYAVNDPRGLAPKGSHIPDEAEWKILTDYLGGEEIAGDKMRASSGWKRAGNGTNESGFTALPAGSRGTTEPFDYGIGSNVFFWSSTAYNKTNVWVYEMSTSFHNAFKSYKDKGFGLSVRCIIDKLPDDNSVSDMITKNPVVEIDNYKITYEFINKEVRFDIISSNYPKIYVDVNQNSIVDNDLDRSYGPGGDKLNICVQYFFGTNGIKTDCGVPASGARVYRKDNAFTFIIPIKELTSDPDATTISVAFDFTDLSNYMHYFFPKRTFLPAEKNYVDFSKIYKIKIP